jgi:hypothetical protein
MKFLISSLSAKESFLYSGKFGINQGSICFALSLIRMVIKNLRGTFYLSAQEALVCLRTKQAKAHALRERFTYPRSLKITSFLVRESA